MNSSTSTTSTSSAANSTATRPSLYQKLVLQAFDGMNRGHMEIVLPDGTSVSFGSAGPHADLAHNIPATAKIQIKRDSFFQKCVFAGDVGFGESFVDGDWTTPDLTAVIAWFIHNVENAPTMSGSKRAGKAAAINILRAANRIGHLLRPNNRTTARRNISEHYDLSNDFFALFLDPSMMYSGARWTSPDLSLEEAQVAKNDLLCQRLQLQRSDHVLEVGSGWGSWSIHAAKTYGCRVTTLTISQEQFDLATERIAAAGLSDRIDIRMCDYRDIQGSFDKIVSIEMMEAIGHRYLPAFCESLHRVLKPNGLIALQFITCPDERYDQLRKGVDYIQKHIFPGSLLLSLNRVNEQMTKAGGFVLHEMEDFGHDYVRTLRAWRSEFHATLDKVKALGFDDRFIRKWNYYLHYCEAAFAMKNISVVHTLHRRANNSG